MENPQPTREVKLIPIGNSEGIRLPKELLQRYGWNTKVVLEEGVILKTNYPGLLSWEEIYRAMAAEGEYWSDYEGSQETDATTPDYPRRYDIYRADLNPTVGAEIQKTRPVVVVTRN